MFCSYSFLLLSVFSLTQGHAVCSSHGGHNNLSWAGDFLPASCFLQISAQDKVQGSVSFLLLAKCQTYPATLAKFLCSNFLRLKGKLQKSLSSGSVRTREH